MQLMFCLRNMEAGNGVVCSGWMPGAGQWSLGDRQAGCWVSKQGGALGGGCGEIEVSCISCVDQSSCFLLIEQWTMPQ